jgi:hypothetical protein
VLAGFVQPTGRDSSCRSPVASVLAKPYLSWDLHRPNNVIPLWSEILSIRIHKVAVRNVPHSGKAIIFAIEEELIPDNDNLRPIRGEILSIRIHKVAVRNVAHSGKAIIFAVK